MRIRIFTVLCIAILAAMLGLGIVVPILPLYARDMGASGTMLGLIFSSFAVTLALANPIMGRLADRIGYKPVLTLGLALHVPVALAYIVAATPLHLILIRLIEGVLSAMVQTVAMAYVGAIAPEGREGSSMGIFSTFLFLGFGLGPLMGGWLTEAYGFTAPFGSMALLLGVAAMLALTLLPAKVIAAPARSPGGHEGHPLKAMLRSNLMKGLLLFALIIAVGESGLFTFLPVLTAREGITTAQIGVLVSVIMLGAGVLQTPFGFLANRWNKVYLIMAGMLMIAFLLALIPWCSAFWMFFTGSLFGGIGAAVANPAATALVIKGSRDFGLGLSMGLYNMFFGAGMVVGPVVSGIIMDLGGLDQVFYVTAVMYLLGTAVIYGYTRDVRDI